MMHEEEDLRYVAEAVRELYWHVFRTRMYSVAFVELQLMNCGKLMAEVCGLQPVEYAIDLGERLLLRHVDQASEDVFLKFAELLRTADSNDQNFREMT